jgi:hypothetical protein
MGTNMPSDRKKALEWVEQHVDPWTENQVAINLSIEQVAAITLLSETAREKLIAAGAARQAAKDATREWHESADQMMSFTSDLIVQLKGFARGEGGQVVYTLAGINPRSNPGEAPPPEVPTGAASTVTNDGDVELRWKGKGPGGTRYHVLRKLPTENKLVFLGDTSEKTFTDTTVPSGASPVVYQIVAVHTDKRVPGEPIYVRMGTGNGPGQGQAVA